MPSSTCTAACPARDAEELQGACAGISRTFGDKKAARQPAITPPVRATHAGAGGTSRSAGLQLSPLTAGGGRPGSMCWAACPDRTPNQLRAQAGVPGFATQPGSRADGLCAGGQLFSLGTGPPTLRAQLSPAQPAISGDPTALCAGLSSLEVEQPPGPKAGLRGAPQAPTPTHMPRAPLLPLSPLSRSFMSFPGVAQAGLSSSWSNRPGQGPGYASCPGLRPLPLLPGGDAWHELC